MKKIFSKLVFLTMIAALIFALIACVSNETTAPKTDKDKECKHSYGEWESVTAPTCTNAGNKKRTCSICKKEETDTVKALGHAFTKEEADEKYLVTAATCTDKAVYHKSCAVCGTAGEEAFEYGDALGHAFTKEEADEKYLVTAATCTDKAVYHKSCVACGEAGTETFEFGEAGHKWGVWETLNEATCTEDGSRIRVCIACGKNETETVISSGHKYIDGICENCGYVKRGATEGLVYELDTDTDTYSVKGYEGTETEVVIPSVYQEKTVTGIENMAFFEHGEITSIEIPDSVINIGMGVFMKCDALVKIEISAQNAKYHSAGNCVIETGSKTLVTGCKTSFIPNDGSVTSIGNFAFYWCGGLTEFNIPESVKSIGMGAFAYSGIKKIRMSDNVTSIGGSAFTACVGLTDIEISKGVNVIESNTFADCGGIESIVIPEGVTSIEYNAFGGCHEMVNVQIPKSVNYIADNTFYNCSNLTRIDFEGSAEDWEVIEKADDWDIDSGAYIVYYNSKNGNA